MSLTEVDQTPEPEEIPEGAFSKVLRERTAAVHDTAEHTPLTEALLGGTLSRDGYTLLLGQLYFVYEALESVAANLRDDPVAAPFCVPELDRLPACEADLAVLLGDDWRDQIAPLDATAAYAARIREVGADWVGGFIGHHYTRYMGDLSGGIFIGGVVRRTYDLTETHGASFYTFTDIPSAKAFKDNYRVSLDSAPWDPDEQVAIVDEIISAYGRNTALFADVWDAIAESSLDG